MSLIADLKYLENAFCNIGKEFHAEFQFSVNDDDRYVGLVDLYIPEKFRRMKHGHEFMEHFTEVLDMHGFGAKLIASEKYSIPLASLIRFYGKHGFVTAGDEFIGDGFKQRPLERPPKSS